ncbi:CaiB/BaiF CoA transferase family protein [Cupriavidus numazuensis]|uniref:Acetyl-CoA:oxalate CoA-transferase n=1 Tax=Cupriavidus numazuensis TaxID=221992 RepID=A0ABM8TSH2_9BURK|nr:CaiB/BaiF CoA-transferase family protein [Cupriavidus numazuensis]CAG2159302.1 Acetyl-CoA:oxalate CoA-transferase [Cupriavidus numazuensis]
MGPLSNLKIIELAGIGPGPMAGTVLAGMGATVLRIDRTVAADLGTPKGALKYQLLRRSRDNIALDLKDPEAIRLVLDLVEQADVLIEGFRPGVTERLGLGPEDCLARNPRLVYGRMTGWGQDGPLAQAAGHDINYISITGVLDAIGRKDEPPAIPLALLGDMAGGAMFLVAGILAALYEARDSGKGQVVDASIAEGAANLATSFYGSVAAGMWKLERGTNILDSGAPFYDVYACKDGKLISIGPLEARFHQDLLERLDLSPESFGRHLDRANWPRLREAFTAAFKTRTRDEWCALLEGTDVCFAPVLNMAEAPQHPHLKARGSFVEVEGVMQPMPAPRFSRTPNAVPRVPTEASPETFADALSKWLPEAEVGRWQSVLQRP